MIEDADSETELDVRDLLCPLPVLRAGKALAGMKSGQVLKVIATDPAAAIDIPHFCNERGHMLLGQGKQDHIYIFRIRRK